MNQYSFSLLMSFSNLLIVYELNVEMVENQNVANQTMSPGEDRNDSDNLSTTGLYLTVPYS